MRDHYLWLEEVHGKKALDWVQNESRESVKRLLSWTDFSEVTNQVKKSLDSKDKIPYVRFIDDGYVYNLWTDEVHLQGLFRRAKIEEFEKPQCQWDILLDLDLESKNDNEKWVFHSFTISPNKKRAMVALSPGGTDADIVREFCLETKKFLEEGFICGLSKGQVAWHTQDELFVMREFGLDSVTSCGYPRTMRSWIRGRELSSAPVIYEIPKEESFLFVSADHYSTSKRITIHRLIDFYTEEVFEFKNQTIGKLNLPLKFEDFGSSENKYFLKIQVDWKNEDGKDFFSGDVIAYDFRDKKVNLVYRPKERVSVFQGSVSAGGLYLIIDRDVKSELLFLRQKNFDWIEEKIELPKNGSLDFLVSSSQNDDFYIAYDSFNKPVSYYHGLQSSLPKLIKSQQSFFNHESIQVEQAFVSSPDGARIPYFIVHKKGLPYNAKNPTILYGYGGFKISIKPHFNDALGIAWLEKGGVYVLANIRGGGEYGPEWHQSAIKANRKRTYQDFFAVAEDLFAKKITSPRHLGAKGRSNGGLLMGVCYTLRPDLFSAIDCGVPLLDMHRYHKLLAGHSWIAEYGNPDDEQDGEYIRNLSPYHRLDSTIKNYPAMYLNTSTKDDRVHPAHARKFAAKLKEFGFLYYYFENIEGGHAGAANTSELANNLTYSYAFFWKHLV